jgi:hypothetical protein
MEAQTGGSQSDRSQQGSRGNESAGSSRGSGWTTDHRLIREWVEERGGWPASVKGTGGKNDAGLLRIDYPGFSGGNRLEKIGWDEFFEKFEQANLAFVYQEETAGGDESRFSKLVDRSQFADEAQSGSRGKGTVGEA